jgi:hypothetical protein
MDKRQEVFDVPFIARDEASEVLQPSEEAFDLPAPAVAAELAAILRIVAARRAVRGDELDPAFCEQSGDDTFDTADSDPAGRATVRLCASPTGHRSTRRADRATDDHDHRGDDGVSAPAGQAGSTAHR